MADIRGIELASDIYGLEDTQGRTATQTAQNTATAASNKADSNETAIEAIQNLIPSTASSSNQLATKADVSAVTSVTSGDITFSPSFISVQSGGYAKWQKLGKIVKVSFYLVDVLLAQTADVTLATGLPIPALDKSIGDISYLNGKSAISGQGLVVLMVNTNGALITQGGSLPNGTLHGSFVYIAQ